MNSIPLLGQLSALFNGSFLPHGYFAFIAPYIVWFSERSDIAWAFVMILVIALKGTSYKMGRHFLLGNTALPILLLLQKSCFIIIETVLMVLLGVIIVYWLSILGAGLIWYRSLAYAVWIARLSLPGILIGTLLGIIASFLIRRAIAKHVEPKYTEKLQALKKTTDDAQSDVRDVAELMEKTRQFNPLDSFKEGEIFIGNDEHDKPITVKLDKFCRNHFQIMGCTGSGKSVAAVVMLAQALHQGISTVVFDPKTGGDEFAPQVLRMMCEEKNIPFTLINLQAQTPQLNLLDKDISQDELDELLQAGMGIEEKGGDSDFYRIKDRKAATAGSHFAGQAKCFPHFDMMMQTKLPELMEKAESFADKLGLLSGIPAVQTETGVNIKDAIDNGHCLYIIGAMRNPQTKLLQKMLLLRIMQIIERRDRLVTHRHVTIFIDELKYFLTRPVLDALSTVRDHACNILLGHQSAGDLADVTKDLNPVAVKGSVIGNSSIKIMYKQNDDVEQKKSAALTGEKIVQRETTKRKSNLGVGEVIDTDERNMMSVPEPLYSANYFAMLEPMVGIIVGLGLAKLCFTSPIKVEKKALTVESYAQCEDYLSQIVITDDVSQPEFKGKQTVSKTTTPKGKQAGTVTQAVNKPKISPQSQPAPQEVITMPVDPMTELNIMDDTLLNETHDLIDFMSEPHHEEP